MKSAPIHVRWFIAVLCVGCLVGVWAAQFNGASFFGGLPWVLVGLLVCVVAFIRRRAWLLLGVFVAGALFGVGRGVLLRAELTEYNYLYGRALDVEGTVADDVDVNRRGQDVLRLKDIVQGENELGGMVWVVVNDKTAIKRSDRVTVSGKLVQGFGTFAASMYNAEIVKIRRAVPGDTALRARDWFSDNVRQVIHEPQASLGVGFLTGQRRSLPDDLANALKVAGLMHIVVASGYNLTILVRLARRGLEKVSKYLTVVVSGVLITGFIAVTGMSPSMSRAGLVAGLSLAAWYYGRTIHPIVLLTIAMGVTVMINPSYAWGDIGWLLSFSAFAGVMLCAPLLQAFYFGKKPPGTMRQIIGETIAAWLFTLPILLVTFGAMSNVAVIANLLIVPLIPLAMLLTFATGVAAWIAIPFGQVLAVPTDILLSYMTQVAMWTASFDWAQREVTITWWQAVLMYIGLAFFCGYMWYRTKHSLRDESIIE